MPPVLTVCLQRFELDYQTWQNKKINTQFEYPLELDMSPYMTAEALQNSQPGDFVYELKSIVIHRGGAYGGHYFAYIHDDLKQGNWHLQKLDQYDEEPTEILTKTFDMKDYMTEEQKKALEDEKNKHNPNYNPN